MRKRETIASILESAIQLFAERGYEGASLRQISTHAGVPLAAANLYFGSKQGLYYAVKLKVWSEIDDERRALLQRAIDGDTGLVSLPDLLEALIRPLVIRALSTDPRYAARIGLLRTASGPPRPRASDLLPQAAETTKLWLEAITAARPALSHTQAMWAFSYVLGAVYSNQILDGVYSGLTPPAPPRDPEDVIAELVAFGCGGIEAMPHQEKFQ